MRDALLPVCSTPWQILFAGMKGENDTANGQFALKQVALRRIAQCVQQIARDRPQLTTVFLAGDHRPSVTTLTRAFHAARLKVITATSLRSAAPDVATFNGAQRSLLDSLLLSRASVCLSSPFSTFSDIATTRSRCEKRMATTCKAVRWRTLPHFGRAIVNDRGEPRPPGCSLFGASPASENGQVVDVASLPCGPPCNLNDEWGGAIICGRPPNASRVSHTSWSIQNSEEAR
eukprot:32249-Prymnesium_polylepis.2